MNTDLNSVLLLDALGELKSTLIPLCDKYNVRPTVLNYVGSYETLKGTLDGNNISVLLVDESCVAQLQPLGLKKLQQDFPDIEVVMFCSDLTTEVGDSFRYFRKPIVPEVVMINIILASRKNQISQRRRRALQVFAQASARIMESKTEDDALREIVSVASKIMEDTGRKGHFSHLAKLIEGSYLVYYPQHHQLEVFELLKTALIGRDKEEPFRENLPAVRLKNSPPHKIGIIGLAAQSGRTQRIDDVSRIPEYITLHGSVLSQIAVPIVYSGRVYGVLSVEYPEKNAFDENDQVALEALSSLIAVGINKMGLMEKAEKRSTALEVIAKMGNWVGESPRLDRDAIFQQAVTRADELMGAKDQGFLSHLFLRKGKKLFFYPAHHKNSSVVQRVLQALGKDFIDLDSPPVIGDKPRRGIVGRAVETGEIQRISHVKDDVDYISFSGEVNSQLAVPIKYDNEIIGAINIEHPKPDAFDEEDEKNLNTLALYVSIALKNGDLYAEIRKKAEQYEVVYQAGHAISQYSDLESVLSEIAKQSLRILGDGEGGVNLFSHVSLIEDSYFLKIRSISPKSILTIFGEGNDGIKSGFDLRKNIKKGISGRAFLDGVELNVPDVSAYSDDFVSIVQGIKSQLSVPIFDGSNPIVVISIESNAVNRFEGEYVKKIKLLSSMAAVVIKNSLRVELESKKLNRDISFRNSMRLILIMIGFALFLNLTFLLFIISRTSEIQYAYYLNIFSAIATILTFVFAIVEWFRRNNSDRLERR